MDQLLIHQYLGELNRLKQASGSTRESIVREAFKDLLKAWGRANPEAGFPAIAKNRDHGSPAHPHCLA